MARQADVRRVALSLPETVEAPNHFAFSVRDKGKLKGFVAKFFTEPHYNGFPAVLVRLPAVTARELRPIITEAWRCQAPKDWDTKHKTSRRRAVGRAGRAKRAQTRE
jgi:hypothetical protein